MKKVLVVAALVAALLLLAGCPGRAPTPQVDPKIAAMRKVPALDWLEHNRNPSAFASNRFGETANAVDYVRRLQAAGATAVYVADPDESPERIHDEDGPYADTLVVQLPADPDQRAALFRMLAKEAEAQGFDASRDHGQAQEMMWWD